MNVEIELKPIFVGYRRSMEATGERRAGGSQTAAVLVRFLRRLGFEVWYDVDLSKQFGIDDRIHWMTETDNRLRTAGTAIILWSHSSQKSERLTHELNLAHEVGNELVLSIDGAAPNESHEGLQTLDFRDFDALELGRNVPLLLQTLVRRCGLPPRWSSIEDMIEAVDDEDLPKYRFGKIEIPATVILGTPDETYKANEVNWTFDDTEHHMRSRYPSLLSDQYEYLFQSALKLHDVNPAKIRDNPLTRIDSFSCLPEGPNDEKGPIELALSRTSYFQIWATNVAVDIPISDIGELHANTLRRLLCPEPTNLERSVLANNLSIETMVVSDADKPLEERSIIIRRRRREVAGYRGWYQSSSSGHFTLAHSDENGVPSPFVSAETEARQEIDYNLDVTPSDFEMFGLVLKHQDLHPEIMGFFQSHKTAVQLRDAECRDMYEGKKSILPLKADEIVHHIAANKWFPLSAVCLLYTGIYFLGKAAMEEAAHRIEPVPAEHFHWGDFNQMDG